MPIILQLSAGNTILSEIILVVIIAALLFVIFKLGKFILRLLFGIIANSILGVVAIFALNYFFALGIPIKLATMVATAAFGLPAVGTFVILRFFGVLL